MAETKPGGRISRIPIEHRGAHYAPTPPREPDLRSAFEPSPPLPTKLVPKIKFGDALPKPERRTIDKKFLPHIIVPGRIVRVGVLEMETDAQTQYDFSPDVNTFATTRKVDSGTIRKDPKYGEVMWRLANAPDSEDERFNTSVWIGWTRDEKGQFSKPLMDPAFIKTQTDDNPTLGL